MFLMTLTILRNLCGMFFTWDVTMLYVFLIIRLRLWASSVAQLEKIHLQWGRPELFPWVGKISWRRERLSTPAFWPEECHGPYSPWDRKELDTTERLSLSLFHGLWEGGLQNKLDILILSRHKPHLAAWLITSDVDLDHLTEVVLVSFLQSYSLFPLFYSVLFGRRSQCYHP